MRKLAILGVLLMTAVHTAWANEQQAVIKDKVNQLVQAQRGFDLQQLEKLLGEEYVEISPKGEIDHRSKVLSFYTADKKPKGPVPQIVVNFEQVIQQGKLARVIASEQIVLPDNRVVGALTAVFTLLKEGSHWRFLSAQYTPQR